MTADEAARAFRDYFEAGSLGDYGSFYTTLLKAYAIADGVNRYKLSQAFPEIAEGYRAAFYGFSCVEDYEASQEQTV